VLASSTSLALDMPIGKIIVWLILGALAGSLAGRVATFSRSGFGRWINLAFGMLGAVVGGFLFSTFNINLGLGELKITLEDVISAFLGSLLCIAIWWLIRRRLQRNKPATPVDTPSRPRDDSSLHTGRSVRPISEPHA
jgi:uncharacterized membrane protein YeaQ/YmgE (transglycosylase-associated protein family)